MSSEISYVCLAFRAVSHQVPVVQLSLHHLLKDHLCSIVLLKLLAKDQLAAFTCLLSCFSLVQFFMTRMLEWVPMPCSGGIFLPRGETRVSLCLLHWHAGSLPTSATWEGGRFHVGLFPSSLFCPTDLSDLLPATVLTAAALREGLELDAVSPSSLLFSLSIGLVILCLLPLQERISQLIGGVFLSDSWRGGLCLSGSGSRAVSLTCLLCGLSAALRWVFRCRAWTRLRRGLRELWCWGWLSVPTTRESLVP